MAYLGNPPQFANFPSKFFSGDSSETNFTLDNAPPNDASLLVFIDGVRQDTSAYNATGTTLAFTAPPPTGTNNIQAVHLGLLKDVATPGDDTVKVAQLDTDSAGTTGQFLKKSSSTNLDWDAVTVGAITTEGDYFYNYNTISSNLTTTVATTKAAFVAGPITIADTFTWTISGELTMI
jgi:hypothetical protein